MASMASHEVTPERVKKLLDSFLSSPFPKYDASYGKSPVQSTLNKSTVDSRDRQSYFQRVETYGALTWLAKPLELSPLVCARYGWENVDTDMLQCVGCKAYLSGELPKKIDADIYPDSCQKLKEKLTEGHEKLCSWSSNPSPESFMIVPYYNRDEIIEDFENRLKPLVNIDQLPEISFQALQKQELDEVKYNNFLTKFYQSSLGNSYKDLCPDLCRKAIILTMCGWMLGDMGVKVLKCRYCKRQIGVWNFIKNKISDKNKSVDTDLHKSDETNSVTCDVPKYSELSDTIHSNPISPPINDDIPCNQNGEEQFKNSIEPLDINPDSSVFQNGSGDVCISDKDEVETNSCDLILSNDNDFCMDTEDLKDMVDIVTSLDGTAVINNGAVTNEGDNSFVEVNDFVICSQVTGYSNKCGENEKITSDILKTDIELCSEKLGNGEDDKSASETLCNIEFCEGTEIILETENSPCSDCREDNDEIVENENETVDSVTCKDEDEANDRTSEDKLPEKETSDDQEMSSEIVKTELNLRENEKDTENEIIAETMKTSPDSCGSHSENVQMKDVDSETVEGKNDLCLSDCNGDVRHQDVECSDGVSGDIGENVRTETVSGNTADKRPRDNGDEDKPCSKRRKLEEKEYFDPLEEHRLWCPWVKSPIKPDLGRLSELSDVSSISDSNNRSLNLSQSSDQLSPSKQLDMEMKRKPGWKIFLHTLAPGLLEEESVSIKEAPHLEGLRHIRKILKDWSSPGSSKG